jgi:hypothetical protein
MNAIKRLLAAFTKPFRRERWRADHRNTDCPVPCAGPRLVPYRGTAKGVERLFEDMGNDYSIDATGASRSRT